MKYSELTIEDCELHEWHERDRDCVELRHIETQATLVIYWDQNFAEAIEDGFLRRGHIKKDLWEMLQEILTGHAWMLDEEIEEDLYYLLEQHPMRDLKETEGDDEEAD